jgi:anti-sigma regulatory factor (Ser/Thr protein kinase)/DNA-binding XRE family transcriptional regulator
MAEVISLAERLKSHRDELGISQSQAARELDVARTAYRLWEMQAARPNPDRWVLIARWLGVSVSTLLLAEELMTEAESATGEVVEADFRRLRQEWDASGSSDDVDFFDQARGLLSEGLLGGYVTDEQATELKETFDRLEAENARAATVGWEATDIRKELVADADAPRKARDALTFAASGLPEQVQEEAALLVSELVTNSVIHGSSDPEDVIGLLISVGRAKLRVEVADRSEGVAERRPTSSDGGYGLTLVDAIASRWGAEQRDGLNITWFDLRLPQPGS